MTTNHSLKVRFYGKLADIFGSERELTVDTPCTAALVGDKRVRACVDGTLVGDDHSLACADEVELLAPVSGG
jgi:hypothetical protein